MIAFGIVAAAAAALIAAAASAEPPTSLFASDAPIHVTIRGPVMAVARTVGAHAQSRPATLAVDGDSGGPLPVVLSPRGITRRTAEICQFAPLRVEFPQKPPPASLFAGQKKLKLVTHCRTPEPFQQYLLLEYSAYRILNLLTPQSLRARLATVDYVDEAGKPIVSRLGFFLEDIHDAAKRNGWHEADVGERISGAQLSAREAARGAVFEYMIANLDWSMIAGPAHERCCHNVKLMAPAPKAAKGLVPVPYDFDMSGMVDSPYAFAPEGLPVSSVRQRRYRGFCIHNAEARAAIAELRGRRAQIEGAFGQVPQLEERSRQKAIAFLDGFFAQASTDAGIARILSTCLD